VRVKGAEPLEADAIIVAVPGHEAARLLDHVDEGVARTLAGITYGTTATVFLGYERREVSHPLDGVGFVVPRTAGRPILAGTWVSSKWDHRAPEGRVLLRVFFGEASAPGLLDRPDEDLVGIARTQLRELMGVEAQPVMTRVFRFARGSAQMKVGHIPMMRAVRETLAKTAPGLLVAGGGYDGVGIPDCVRQGQEAGRAAVDGS
jgi:oxygen-dependent protoporphyrinogen oxidase